MVICILCGFLVFFKLVMSVLNCNKTNDVSELTFVGEDNEYFNGLTGLWHRMLVKRRLVGLFYSKITVVTRLF